MISGSLMTLHLFKARGMLFFLEDISRRGQIRAQTHSRPAQADARRQQVGSRRREDQWLPVLAGQPEAGERAGGRVRMCDQMVLAELRLFFINGADQQRERERAR